MNTTAEIAIQIVKYSPHSIVSLCHCCHRCQGEKVLEATVTNDIVRAMQ